jgi:hypothetical protein
MHRDSLEREWIGTHEKRLSATIRTRGGTAEDIDESVARFNSLCFGGTLRPVVYDLFLQPPPAEWRAWAFRETKPGAEKEGDHSVLWNTIKSVQTAIEGSKAAFVDRALRAIGDAVEYGSTIDESVADAVENNLSHLAGDVLLYHPLVIVESRLWSSDDDQLTEIPSCRLYRVGQEWLPPWCDVVTLDAAPDYLKRVTQYYSAQLNQAPTA